jgi:glycosyltransferase involved in cell wall biosynthesis
MLFSIIVPVFNRPDELHELLESLCLQDYQEAFEVVVVEDGSLLPAEKVVSLYQEKLNITYFYKPNTGPGHSRNFGMTHAKGDYFLIFDSDCILPTHYLSEVHRCLQKYQVDCFGGPDAALPSFTSIQLAINASMTSFFTTGGIRGGAEKLHTFQPRSFNMGISKKAFIASGGFGNIHPGEDPELSMRLWELGFETKRFENAFVYHKRRISWQKFYEQVHKFGKARPILDSKYPKYQKIVYFFPTLFCFGLFIAMVLFLFKIYFLSIIYTIYLLSFMIYVWIQTARLKVALLAVIAMLIQFYGYGMGFLESLIKVRILRKQPEKVFPELFFKF